MRMLTDWTYPAPSIAGSPLGQAGEARRYRSATGIVKSKQVTADSRRVLTDVMVRNQAGEKVATGEAMVEFPNWWGGVSGGRVEARAYIQGVTNKPQCRVAKPLIL
jgi:hypothetical protein